MILTDTSVLIDFFKNKNNKVSEIIKSNEICVADIIIYYLENIEFIQ